MPDDFLFEMGKYQAQIPRDLRYCKNHMWCRPSAEGCATFGFSAYAVRLMQDVYFLEWNLDAPTSVTLKQEIGFIESSKAQSELYSPCAGVIESFNAELLNDPSGINAECYGSGWLFTMQGEFAETMPAEDYLRFLDESWKLAQRLIKKQILE